MGRDDDVRRVLWMPFELPYSPPSIDVSFCCAAMAKELAFDCRDHDNPFDCDSLLVYNEVFDEIGMVVHDGTWSYVLLCFCPWCGSTLRSSQRDRWFEFVERLDLSEDDELPPSVMTAAWRRDTSE